MPIRLPVSLLTFLALAIAVAACSSGGGGKTPPASPAGATSSAGTPVATAPAAAGAPQAGAYRAERALSKLDYGPVTGLYPIPGDDGFAYLLEKAGRIRQVQ